MEFIEAAFEPCNRWFEEQAKIVSFPADQLKFVSVLLMAYVAAIPFHFFPNIPAVKHLYSIIVSWFFCTFCLGPYAIFHSLFTASVTYVLLAVLPRGLAHKVNFVFVLGYMSLSHIYRMYVDYLGWSLDFTTMQMVLTIKLTSLGFNLFDADVPNLPEENKQRSIKKLPSVLEYFGWVYFCPSFMAGPPVEYTEYRDFLDGSMFKDFNGHIPPIRLCILPALKNLAIGFFFLPFSVLSGMYPMSFLVSAAFLELPFYLRVVNMYYRTSLARQKYYFAWYVAEGASIMAGIGYEGKDANGTMRWRRLKNADPIKVEFAVNMYSITMYWNMRTALWLRLYVYNRLNSYSAKSWQKRFSTYLTMMTSAFWHGFYPGYYTFFITSAIYTELGRDIRRVIRPLFVKEPQKSSLLYDTITRFFTGIYLNYAGASFLLLDGWRGLQLFSGLYYFVHITSIALLVALRSPPLNRIGRKEKAK